MRLASIILLTLLVGCAAGGANPESDLAQQAIPTATPTRTPTTAPTLAPTAAPTFGGTTRLQIWMPEPLAPLDNGDAADQRADWVSTFEGVEDNVEVAIRLKKANDIGGILQTLRSAALVAPSALPDLALLRRADLITAAGAGLIQPLDPVALAAVTEDMPDAILELGTVNEQLMGLGYTVDVAHLAVSPDAMPDAESDTNPWTFEAVLARGGTLLFPAGRANTVNETFLAQYREAANAADRLSLPIDVEALEAVLSFYQQAAQAGIVPSSVLNYTSSADYLTPLIAGDVSMGMMSSSSYLSLRREDTNLAYAPMPTLDGTPATVIDGWMWVITTADAGRQTEALRFLNWIFDVERHATYAAAIAMLPTGRTTLRQFGDSDYATFVDGLIDRATLPLTDSAGGATGRAIQGALVMVLQGESTAADAAADVVEQLNGS